MSFSRWCCRAALAAAVLVGSGAALAGEKALMHCFAFTVIESATDAEWAAFKKATDELPAKIKGVKRVWHGKLRRPLAIYAVDADARAKLNEGGPVTAAVRATPRQHGVCMEMADEAALAEYAKHPAHTDWVKVYEKVRVAGTTTFDILGE
jgi:hypothetical protein